MTMLVLLGLLCTKAWEQDFHEAMAFHPQLLIDAVNDAKNSMTIDVPMSSNDTCCKCIGNIGCHAVKETMTVIEKWCKEHPPHKKGGKMFCHLLEKKPKVVEGMVIFWIHPLQLGLMYCLGHGDCKHKPNITEFIEDDMKFGLEHVVHHVNMSNAEMKKELVEFHKGDHNKHKKMMKYLRHHREDKPGPHCMEAASKKVMDCAIKKVKAWCEHAKCPKAKAICKWAAEHKAIAFGYVLAMVEPWKFAMGYCWPHHHDHYDHHGHSHYHDEEDVIEEKAIYA